MGQRPSRQTGRASLALLCYQAANQDPLLALDLATRIYAVAHTASLYHLPPLAPNDMNNQLTELRDAA